MVWNYLFNYLRKRRNVAKIHILSVCNSFEKLFIPFNYHTQWCRQNFKFNIIMIREITAETSRTTFDFVVTHSSVLCESERRSWIWEEYDFIQRIYNQKFNFRKVSITRLKRKKKTKRNTNIKFNYGLNILRFMDYHGYPCISLYFNYKR